MLERLLMPILMLAALVWSAASFSAALPLLRGDAKAAAAAAARVELPRVVIVGKRLPPDGALASNELAEQGDAVR